MRVKNLLDVINGEMLIGNLNQECENFSKDTRVINKDDIYIGLKGEKYDGSIFWKEAFDKGASVSIINKIDILEEDLKKYNEKQKTIIKVEDTKKALEDIARYKRSLYDIPVIAVTGSVGKTSTKDIIASVLSQKYNTLKTQGNMNNDIGVPLTILNLKNHEAAVIEMGMNHLGEISELTKIAKPTVSVITNVGTAHIGNLESRDNILKAKLEILDGMEEKKIVINNDNDLLHNWYENDTQKYNIKIENIYTYGIDNNSKMMASDIILKENDSEFTCKFFNEKEENNIKVLVGGKHFVYNALCAAEVGKILGLSDAQIKKGIEKFELTKRRMDIIRLKNGAKVINDSYNASYESMKASLAYLKNVNAKRKIAVLGDMFELGEYSEELHKKVGEEVVKNNIDILICSGKNSKNIINMALKLGMNENNIFYLKNKQEIVEKLNNILEFDDVVLIKASNGMKYYEIINEIN